MPVSNVLLIYSSLVINFTLPSQHFSAPYMVARWPYRISAIYVQIPVISCEAEDDPLLTHFFKSNKKIQESPKTSLLSFHWSELFHNAYHGRVSEMTLTGSDSNQGYRRDWSSRENDLREYIINSHKDGICAALF